jgi:eukaryotic-like serine/threonine-protein kinase
MSDASPASGKAAPEPGASTPKRLGKYEIQRMLGKGGMGAVYLAQDTLLKRLVALKVLPKDKAKNPTLVKRFHAEARSAAALRHDNIVMLYENGQADGYDYIALEFVDGTDAARLINTRGILPVRRATEIIKQVAQALDHAQQQGVVHRDIKPANLLIRRDGVVKLADMGLARIVDETLDTGITRAGTTVGTVDYMSPEQARDSKAADIRSDLYSLGCTWYFLLTGEPPFPDGALTNKLRAHAEKPCPDPRLKNNKVPETVVAVLNRMMAKHPKDRYQHPLDLIADLDRGSEVKHNVTRAILDDDSSSEIVVGPVAAFSGASGPYLDESDHEVAAPVESKAAEPKPVESKSAGKSKRAPVYEEPEDEEESPHTRRKKPQVEQADEEQVPVEDSRPKRKPRPQPVVEETEDEDVPDTRRQKKRSETAPEEDEFASDVTPNRGNRSVPAPDVDLYSDEDEPAPRKKKKSEPEPEAVEAAPRKKTRATEPEPEEPIEAPPRLKKKKKKAAEESSSARESGGLMSKLSIDPEKFRAVGFYAVTAALVVALLGGGVYLFMRMNRPAGGNNVVVGPFGEGGAGQVAVAPGAEAGGVEAKEKDDRLTAKTKTLPDLPRTSSPTRTTRPEPGEWEKDNLPLWPGEPLPQEGMQVVDVEHRPTAEVSYTSLNPHLDKLGKSGGILRLRGLGPFALRPASLVGRGPLLILGEKPDVRPLVVALPSVGEQAEGPVTLIKTDRWVALRDVDLVADPALFPRATSLTWLECGGGDVDLRNCKISMCGPDSNRIPTTAARIVPPSVDLPKRDPAGTRAIVDSCLARGDRFTLLEVESPKAEVVVRRTLVWSGDGPALRMAGRAPDDAPETLRHVRVRRSTFAGNTGAPVEIAGDASRPVPTRMDVRTTWLASATGGPTATLVALSGWNVAQARGALGRKLKFGLVDSQAHGFGSLIQLRGDETATVATSADDWAKNWNDEAVPEASSFVATTWPSSPPDSAYALRVDGFETSLAESPGGVSTRPGYAIDERTFPGSAVSERVAGESRKPALPAWLTDGGAPPQTIEIDLSKDDLAKTLMRPDLPPGTLIVARGSGAQPLAVGPVVIRKNWLRVRFETPDGRMLVLQPKGVDEAWLTVIDGGLELSQVALISPPGDRNPVPRTFIHATGSDLVLRSCRVQSPLATSTRNQVLVHTEAGASSTPPARPGVAAEDSSRPARVLLVADSYLSGFRTLVEADLPDAGLFLRNSVLVSRGDVVQLAMRSAAGKRPGAWDCRASTLSGSDSLFRVTSEVGTPQSDTPHLLRNERTLFAPPLVRAATGKPAPVVLAAQGPVLTERQVAWFEERCGYAAEWNESLLRDSGAKESLGWSEWENAWGTERLILALRGATEVILDGDLASADRAKLEPNAFSLAKSCRAGQWADGGPIGANVGTLKVGLGKPGLFPGFKASPNTKSGRPLGL